MRSSESIPSAIAGMLAAKATRGNVDRFTVKRVSDRDDRRQITSIAGTQFRMVPFRIKRVE